MTSKRRPTVTGGRRVSCDACDHRVQGRRNPRARGAANGAASAFPVTYRPHPIPSPFCPLPPLPLSPATCQVADPVTIGVPSTTTSPSWVPIPTSLPVRTWIRVPAGNPPRRPTGSGDRSRISRRCSRASSAPAQPLPLWSLVPAEGTWVPPAHTLSLRSSGQRGHRSPPFRQCPTTSHHNQSGFGVLEPRWACCGNVGFDPMTRQRGSPWPRPVWLGKAPWNGFFQRGRFALFFYSACCLVATAQDCAARPLPHYLGLCSPTLSGSWSSPCQQQWCGVSVNAVSWRGPLFTAPGGGLLRFVSIVSPSLVAPLCSPASKTPPVPQWPDACGRCMPQHQFWGHRGWGSCCALLHVDCGVQHDPWKCSCRTAHP